MAEALSGCAVRASQQLNGVIPQNLTSLPCFISPDGLYRYWLRRDLDLQNPCKVVFFMLNPSTADAQLDDPTIRRVKGFAERLNCGAVGVVNLFARRATNPKDLESVDDPWGALNAKALNHALMWGDVFIAAWGASPSKKAFAELHREMAQYVLERADYWNREVHCLGLTKDGAPRHPLYLPNDANAVRFGQGAS